MATIQFKPIKKQQRVMHMAHLLYEYSKEVSCISNVHPDWSRSMQDAWAIQRVREAMLKGVVRLYFLKQDGTHAMRYGTLCDDHIPSSKQSSGAFRAEIEQGLAEPVWNRINYYDLDKHAWRSFDVSSLNKAVSVTMINNPIFVLKERLY